MFSTVKLNPIALTITFEQIKIGKKNRVILLYEKMIIKMRVEAELHGIFMLHFLMLYTVTVQYVR